MNRWLNCHRELYLKKEAFCSFMTFYRLNQTINLIKMNNEQLKLVEVLFTTAKLFQIRFHFKDNKQMLNKVNLLLHRKENSINHTDNHKGLDSGNDFTDRQASDKSQS